MIALIRFLTYYNFIHLILFGTMVLLVAGNEDNSTSTEICACRDRKTGNSSAALIASQTCCESANGVWENNYCTITDDGKGSDTCGPTDSFGDCCSYRMHMQHKCIAK
ncbi:hypothetical protein BDA99DRAFT_563898 [Phascolomyces articulosus]|uniref:Uncharacterized protein n=1 Tax=Phascolomyces articulosus TaxID=60185 RepID=A0AAD5P9J7_9FUNG|nr:hypothetical protein BDA99DRAFT_563898 [Phascolomyces articulosus]